MTLEQHHQPTATDHTGEEKVPSGATPTGGGDLCAQLERLPATIPTAPPANCDHVERACVTCLCWWALDYDIRLDHTAAVIHLADPLLTRGVLAGYQPTAEEEAIFDALIPFFTIIRALVAADWHLRHHVPDKAASLLA